MGAGSASPLVSMTTRSNGATVPASRRRRMSSSVSTRSPRIVQHRQPVCSSTKLSSLVSIRSWSSPTSPNSLMITAVRENCGLLQQVPEQRGLAAAEKAREHDDGDHAGRCRARAQRIGGSRDPRACADARRVTRVPACAGMTSRASPNGRRERSRTGRSRLTAARPARRPAIRRDAARALAFAHHPAERQVPGGACRREADCRRCRQQQRSVRLKANIARPRAKPRGCAPAARQTCRERRRSQHRPLR